jgi:hypothetical protein
MYSGQDQWVRALRRSPLRRWLLAGNHTSHLAALAYLIIPLIWVALDTSILKPPDKKIVLIDPNLKPPPPPKPLKKLPPPPPPPPIPKLVNPFSKPVEDNTDKWNIGYEIRGSSEDLMAVLKNTDAWVAFGPNDSIVAVRPPDWTPAPKSEIIDRTSMQVLGLEDVDMLRAKAGAAANLPPRLRVSDAFIFALWHEIFAKAKELGVTNVGFAHLRLDPNAPLGFVVEKVDQARSTEANAQPNTASP